MKQALDYSPPPPSDGILPVLAMLYGIASGPVAVGMFLVLHRALPNFDALSAILLIVLGVFGSAAVLALVVLVFRGRTSRGSLLATIGLASLLAWAVVFFIYAGYVSSTIT